MTAAPPNPTNPAIRRFMAFRKTIGQTPRLHRATINARGLQFATYSTNDPQNGSTPILCVNGGLIFDHKILWPALAPLARHRQVILYDQRGRGHSAIPPAAHASRIEFDAGDLAALPTALDLPKLHLLGHSWGGGISMLSTTFGYDRLASLTLINPVGLDGGWLPQLTPSGAERLTGPARERLLAADAAIRPGSPTAADPAALSEYAAALYPAWFADRELGTLFSPPRATSVTGAAISARLRREGYDWHDKVGPLHLPTLLIHGTDDLLPLAMARETAATLGPATTLLPIPDAGHNPFWEQPSVVFTAIDDFLASTERASLP